MTATMFEIMGVWLVAILLGVPLYAALGLAAVAFVWLAGMPADIVPQKLAQSINSFPLLAAPLFILMGNIMNSAGITDRIFTFATACVGWVRGGLCHANILASVIFAGMSGSAVAAAGGVGSLEIRAMKKEGYDAETAAAITAASATIGPIIPPSLPMVIYGVSADVSIGGLFLAGVIPGLLMAGSLAAMVSWVAVRRDLPRHPFPGVGDVWRAYKRAHPWSSGQGPCSASYASARSLAVRAIGPRWSRLSTNGNVPVRDSRPKVGFRLKTPQREAGTLSDPLVSDPSDTGASPAAVAAPQPDEEPPLIRPKSCGFRQTPSCAFSPVKS